MPLFDYVCSDCQNHSELLVRGREEPECPRCGSLNLSRQLGVVASPVVKQGSRASQPLPMAGGCGRSACAQGGCQGFSD
ncbi:MAG: zinc ribbon domain-containing protein [Pirellulaceae bacterium]|nr:zinc ribbon domain-containing protein [Pirellulaceae bacterium]